MADNTTLDPGASGDAIVTREITHAGDTAKLQGLFLMGIAGSEGSYTAAAIDGDATNGIDVDVTRVGGTVAVSNAGLTELAAAIDTEVQCDIVGALPAGTNAIGKLAANSGVDIGDVDVTSIAAGDNNIGNVDIVTVPTDPFGANADAASATGSISAKLKFIASTGIPVTGTVAVTQSGTWDEVGINDSGNSITVDAPVGTPAFVRLSDGSSVITTLPVSLASVPSHAVTNAGTFVTQVDGAALTALQLIDDSIFTDDAAFTPGTSKVNVSGFEADETATDSVDEGDAGAARMTLDRKQIVNPQPHTQGGLSIFRSLDIDETEEDVKTSAGQIYGWYIFNAVASIRYVKFYNATAANVTVGSTTPVITLPVPTSSTNGVGFVFNSALGIAFDTAISVACTTGLADADTGAPGANDVIIQVLYK